jgi:L-asparaginase
MEFNKDLLLINRSPFGSEVLVIYTGGTMGMSETLKDGYLVPRDFSRIADTVPELLRINTNISLLVASNPLDSTNVQPHDWQALAQLIFEQYENYDGFVVLHGTDTMAFTASALSFMLEGLEKPIVFTGAQLPLDSVRTDARENLISAITIAGDKKNGKAIVPEVCIYFDGHLYRANRAQKSHSNYFDAFGSYNYPLLGEAGINIEYNLHRIKPVGNDKLELMNDLELNVVVLRLYPGIQEQVVRGIIANASLKGLILETYGMGNAPTLAWLDDVLRELKNRNVVVLNISQCPGGMVVQGRYETSRQLKAQNVIGGADLTTEAALTKMMFVLGNEPYKQEPEKYIRISLRGEMTDVD